MDKDFYVLGKKYTLHSFVGTAVGQEAQSQTKVWGDEYAVHSKITTYNDIYLLNEQGQEKHYQLVDWAVPMRLGHQIQILGMFVKQNEGRFICAYNISLDEITWCEIGLKRLAYEKYFWIFLLIGLVLFVTTFIGAVLAYVAYKVVSKRFIKAVKEAARKELA